MEQLLDVCPACQIGHLESYGSKMCCSNTRCSYTETCSDGGCGVQPAVVRCEKCGRDIPYYVTEHHCLTAPKEYKEPPSTAESDYRSLHDDLSKRPNDRVAEL